MAIQIRTATVADAEAMAALINEIIAIGGTTAFRQLFDADGVVEAFIEPERFLSCVVATDATQLFGFQSLVWWDPERVIDGVTPAEWAIIATYVARSAHGRGVGRALFAETVQRAQRAGARFIDATIRRENAGGLAFYGGLGFVDYRASDATISKRFALDAVPSGDQR